MIPPQTSVHPLGFGVARLDVDSRPVSNSDFDSALANYASSAWRLELLSAYATPTSNPEFRAFLEGKPVSPQITAKASGETPWCKLIREHVSAGRYMGRVHVLPETLTPYIRFEIEWGYVFNRAVGDDIRLIPGRSVSPEVMALISQLQDFWILDDTRVLLCDYNPDGTWAACREVLDSSTIELCRRARTVVEESSMSFESFMTNYRAGVFG